MARWRPVLDPCQFLGLLNKEGVGKEQLTDLVEVSRWARHLTGHLARKFSEAGTVAIMKLLHTMVQKQLKSTNTTSGHLASLEGIIANYSNISINSTKVCNTI